MPVENFDYFMQIDSEFEHLTPISRRVKFQAISDYGARLCRWENYIDDVDISQSQEIYQKIFSSAGKLLGVRDLKNNYWLPEKNGSFRKKKLRHLK